MEITLSFGEILSDLRHAKNMKQQDLALQLHVDRKTISSYESGNSLPTIKNILKIADIFGVSVDYLFGRTSAKIPWSSFEKNFLADSSLTLGNVAEEIASLSDKSKQNLLEYIKFLQTSEHAEKQE